MSENKLKKNTGKAWVYIGFILYLAFIFLIMYMHANGAGHP